MNRVRLIAFLFCSLWAASGFADYGGGLSQAQQDDNFLNQFSAKKQLQQKKIEKAYKKGLITRQDLRVLSRGQAKLAQLEQRFKADGQLNQKEKQVLSNKLDMLNQKLTTYRYYSSYQAVKPRTFAETSGDSVTVPAKNEPYRGINPPPILGGFKMK
ncbi:MAG: hypothetical protein KGZ88_13460 [Methylomicrobium sp.]|nr:hypothetical protein [Methylomicrobium sp.]